MKLLILLVFGALSYGAELKVKELTKAEILEIAVANEKVEKAQKVLEDIKGKIKTQYGDNTLLLHPRSTTVAIMTCIDIRVELEGKYALIRTTKNSWCSETGGALFTYTTDSGILKSGGTK
jgi:hypothetical protein